MDPKKREHGRAVAQAGRFRSWFESNGEVTVLGHSRKVQICRNDVMNINYTCGTLGRKTKRISSAAAIFCVCSRYHVVRVAA
jgi:hypothetical protein